MAEGPRSERQGNAGPGDTPPYLWAVGAGGVVFALYVLTLAPTTQFWDTSEYIATAHILGIPHPPGNPLFVVLAKAWTLLLAPFGLSVAVRVNLFSAFMSASAHAFWFLVIHQLLRSFSADRVFRLGGAAAAVLVSATAFTVWSQSNVNEKVYHLMAFLAAPALGVFILLVKPGTVLNWRLYPPMMGAALLGLSIHLFLPIRAEFDPIINEAAPECAALSKALLSVATYGRVGCQPLNEAITRDQYTAEGEPGPGFSGPRQATLRSQITNYLQYFDWQWARAVDGKRVVFAPLRLPFTFLFLGLGVLGAIKHFRREPASFWYFLILFGTLSGGLVYYLNFKYGYSLEAPVQDFNLHEVRERDYFFIASFSVWGLWAGMGIAALWRGSAMRFDTTLLRAVPVLGLALIPLVANWGWANRNYDFAARDWAHNLLMSVEPYGVLFTNGDNDTFPLWYLQEVEGIRRDVTVIVGTYLNSAWYAKQLRELTMPCPRGVQATDDPTRIICQRVYTAHNTDSIYVDDLAETGGKIPLLVPSPIRLPTRSILPFDDETVARVARAWLRLDRGQSIPLGQVAVTLREGQIVSPGMQYALAVISQSLGDRPIYFSSNGGAASNLGLSPYLVRQGLAYRFHPGELADSAVPGLVRIADSQNRQLTGDWVDAPRTRTLLEEVFAHHSGIPDEWDHWPDRSELSIPRYYAFAYLSLAEVAARVGSPTTVEQYLERAEAWMVLGS